MYTIMHLLLSGHVLSYTCIFLVSISFRNGFCYSVFVEEKMGTKFVEARAVEFAKSYEESSASVPTFFILSPGVDPLKDVEKLGKKLGFTTDNDNFHNVSLGQGQEEVAEHAMDVASVKGHWVILQNIHLVARHVRDARKYNF